MSLAPRVGDSQPPRVSHRSAACCADVSKISSRLVEDSKKFKWNAKRLNLLDAWKKYGPVSLVVLFVIAVLYWRFFL